MKLAIPLNQYVFSIDNMYKEANKKIQTLAAELDVYNIDFSELLCARGCMPADENGNILYYDDDHLNVFGAKYLYHKYRKTQKYNEFLDYLSS